MGLFSGIGKALFGEAPKTEMKYIDMPGHIKAWENQLGSSVFGGLGDAVAGMQNAMNGKINDGLMTGFKDFMNSATGQAVSQLNNRGFGNGTTANNLFSGVQRQASDRFFDLANAQYNWGNNWLNNGMNMYNMANANDQNRHWIKQTPGSQGLLGGVLGGFAQGYGIGLGGKKS